MKIKTISEMNNARLFKEAKITLMWFFESCNRYNALAAINAMNEKLSYIESITDDDNHLLGFINYSIFPPNEESDACVVVLNIGVSEQVQKEKQKELLQHSLIYLRAFGIPIVYIGKNKYETEVIAQTGLTDAIISLQELEE